MKLRMKKTTVLLLQEMAKQYHSDADKLLENIAWDWFVKHSVEAKDALRPLIMREDNPDALRAYEELKRELEIHTAMTSIDKHLQEIATIEARLFKLGQCGR